MTPRNDELLFLALGGSGEIGMNLNLYGHAGKWLMVDMGVTFGNAEYPGIDIILPDIGFIEERLKQLVGIVLTHGHEDHIGAVAYLAADLGVPIYANRFTAMLVQRKLAEEKIDRRVKLVTYDVDAPFALGPFRVTPVELAHSIPEMNALLIETAAGSVFHSGDWKIDNDPRLGTPEAEQNVRRAVGDGVRALVCDSTNVFNAEAAGSEASVVEGLTRVVRDAPGRVLVTSFASNVGRLDTIGEVAKATGRRLCVAGRSLDRYIATAKACGYLDRFPETVDWETAMRLPRGEVLIVATGGQGEPRAALSRIAEGEHPIKLERGDRVVFSSRHIPGNEIAIGRVMNLLAEREVETITERQAHIHVSGHPGQPELKLMYEWVRPELLIPVHGEIRHLLAHARFAKANGIPEALVQQCGQIVRIAPGPAAIVGHARAGRLVLDGDMIVDADGGSVNERRKLAVNGHASVAVSGRQAEVTCRGLPVEPEERNELLADARKAALDAARSGERDRERRREAVRLAVRRVLTDWTGKKPIVDVLLLD